MRVYIFILNKYLIKCSTYPMQRPLFYLLEQRSIFLPQEVNRLTSNYIIFNTTLQQKLLSIQHSPSIKNQADTKSKGQDFKPLPLMNAHHNTKTKLCPCITLGDIKLGCYTLYENSRNYNLKSFISSKLVSFYFLDKLSTFWTSPHTHERWKTKV